MTAGLYSRSRFHFMEPRVTQAIEMLHAASLIAVLVYAGLSDLRSGRIAGAPLIACLILGLGLGFIHGGLRDPGPSSLLMSASGMALALVLFFPAYVLGWMGAADVKLMAAVGALTNPFFVVWGAFYSSLAGAVMALVALAMGKGKGCEGVGGLWASKAAERRERIASGEAGGIIPYGAAICAGCLFTVYSLVAHGHRLPWGW